MEYAILFFLAIAINHVNIKKNQYPNIFTYSSEIFWFNFEHIMKFCISNVYKKSPNLAHYYNFLQF